MKTNYTVKALVLFTLLMLSYTNLNAQANVRISKVDPATNSVTLKNFGDMNAPISGYWFCVVPAYSQLSSMTTVTTLAPGEEVDIASSVNLVASSGEFGLYSTSGFGSANNMLDFLQWGTGSSGSSRESVAVAAGLWVADTFITVTPPYQYGGDGTQNGVANWSTLNVNEFEENNTVNLFPNPSSSNLNIQLSNTASNGKIAVYDMLGKQIYNSAIKPNVVSKIDVSQWDTGLYLVKISSDSGEETRRFVKQ